LLEVARTVVGLAREGLARRARLNWDGEDETRYLAPLEETVATGLTPAEVKLRRYEHEWGRSVDPLFTEFAF
jgi:glutamate--cysteine ligase